MKISKQILILLVICVVPFQVFAQDLMSYQKSSYELKEISKYPRLAIDYSKSVETKIATRKTEYRKGENLIIRYAIRNISDAEIFIRKDTRPEIAVYDKDKKLIEIMVFLIEDFVTIPQNFGLFEKYDYFLGEIDLLAGCEGYRNHYSNFSIGDRHIDNKNSFEKNRFTNWGRNGCIDIDKEDSISIVFTTRNPFLMINKNRKAKHYPTAVGETKSNVLELKIIN